MKKILLLFFLLTFSIGFSQNLISNSYFTSGGTGWVINGPGTFTGGEAVFPNTAAGGNPWDNELKQTGKTLTSGATYTLTFRARAASNRTMSVNIQNTNVWNDHFRNNSVALTTTMTVYSYTFTATSVSNTPNNVQLNFHVAGTGSTAAVYIDDVTLVAGTTTQCTNFIQDGDETGIDCGGSTCGACLINPTFETFTIGSKFLGDAAFTVTATSDSPGTITYSSSNTAVASINSTSGLITIAGPGTTTITATQAASGGYYAGSTNATLTVTPPAAPIPPVRNSWDVVSLYSDSYSPTAGATWQNGANVSISGNNARFFDGFTLARLAFTARSIAAMTTLHIDVYTLNQNQLWFEINGNRKVVSSIPLNGWASFDIPLSDYVGLNLANVSYFDLNNPTGAAAPVKQVYLDNIYFYRAATLQPPTIGSFTVPTKVVGDAPFTLTAPTSNNTNPFTYTSSNTNVATISGNTVTVVGGGISTITASQSSDGTYGAGSVTAQLSVLPPAAPTPPARVATDVISYYSGAYAVESTPTWSSSSTNTDVSLGGNNARFVSSFTFGQIAFAAKNVSSMSHIHVDVYSLDATLLWLWVGSNRKDINVTPNTWTSIDIPLSQYSAIGVNLTSVNVVKIENPLGAGTLRNMYVDNIYFYFTPTVPTISNFSSIAKVVGDAPFTLNATSNSPATITYTSSNESVATISGNTVTVVGVGTSTLTASQIATGSYAAGSATATLTVTSSTTPLTGPTTPPDRNAWDVFSVFSDKATYTVVPGTRNYNPGWGQAGSASVVSVGGDDAWRAVNLNYQGMTFGSNVDVSAMTTFHVDVWTFDETSLQFFQISNTTGERSVAIIPLVQGQWNSYDIPLTAWTSQSGFTTTALKEFKIVGSGGKTVYLDNMYFYRAATLQPPTLGTFAVAPQVLGVAPFPLTPPTSNSNGAFSYTSSNTSVATISGNTISIVGVGSSTITVTQATDGTYGPASTTATLTVTPSAAPNPPARNAWDVISYYSGAYTNTSPPNWGQGSDVSIEGNTTRLLSNYTLGQLNFASVNVSAMTTLHIDIFSVNQNPTWIRLNGIQQYVATTPVNGWTSLDIPLSSFTGANLTAVTSVVIFNPTGAEIPLKTAYVDNVYFYRSATTLPPTIGSLTVPSPKIVGDAPFVLTNPTSNSSGAWTYSASPAGIVTISGNTVTIVGGGTATITATQAADGSYGSAFTTAQLVVNFPPPGPSPVPPARDPSSVISMYTGTPAVYTNAPNYNFGRAFWTAGATLTEIPNGTNTALRVDNLGYIGFIDIGDPAPANRERRLNVSTMNNLHLDIYVNQPFANLFFWLLTNGDQRRDITNLVAGWNSIDIPLSEFTGANLASVYGLKFEQNQPGTLQMYIDNVYFSKACYTPTATIVSNGGDFCPGSNATFTVNGTEDSTLDYTITGQEGTQQLLLTGANQTITAVNPSGDVTLDLLTVTNALCLTTTSSSTFETGSSTVSVTSEIDFNNVDDDCDGSLFNGHAPVVVDITTASGALATMTSSIDCDPATNTGDYSGVDVSYKFKVTKTNIPTSVAYVTSSSPNFDLTLASNAAHSSTYDVQATAIVNGEEQPYNGNTQSYTTPAAPTISNPPTQAGPSSVACAYTIARIDSYIYANNSTTYGATRYEFLVERMDNGNPVQTVSVATTVPYFKLTNIAGIPSTMQVTYGTTYRISVRYGYGATSFGSQIYTAYGSSCLVSTPSLPIASIACGTSLASINAFVYASGQAAAASQFEFKVTRVSPQQPGELPITVTEEILPRNVANFKLTMLTQLFVGLQKEYSVSVRYRVTAYGMDNYSVWSTASCSLFTPDFPETQIIEAQCGVEGVPSTVNEYVYADGVPGATQYQFRLFNSVDLPYTEENPYDYTVYSPNNYVKLNQFPGLVSGIDYSVTVVAQLNGEYPNIALAKDCSITAPASTPTGPAKAVVAELFRATAYPNPFANNFMIAVKSGSQSAVDIKVYDMIGRLIESRKVTLSDMETTTIGGQYPSGVYNVVVSQDDELQTIRVVKR